MAEEFLCWLSPLTGATGCWRKRAAPDENAPDAVATLFDDSLIGHCQNMLRKLGKSGIKETFLCITFSNDQDEFSPDMVGCQSSVPGCESNMPAVLHGTVIIWHLQCGVARHWQGCRSRFMFSNPELTQDHVFQARML